MKISEVSLSAVKAHCGISGEDSDELLKIYMSAAIKIAADYTGLTEKQLDEYPDITVAYLNIHSYEVHSYEFGFNCGFQCKYRKFV